MPGTDRVPSSEPIQAVLKFSEAVNALREAGIVRSRRLFADLGEWYVELLYGAERSPNPVEKGWDVKLPSGERAQVKAQSFDPANAWNYLESDPNLFDRLIALILADDFKIRSIFDVPTNDLRKLLRTGKEKRESYHWKDLEPFLVDPRTLPGFGALAGLIAKPEKAAADPAGPVLARQRTWAHARKLPLDQDYTLRLEDNLFQPLHPDTRREYEAGAGKELGRPGKAGKMQALRSSAALVVNLFDYWRGKDLSAIAAACGADQPFTAFRFEQVYPTSLRGEPPHLDVVFTGADVEVLAIESKFLEPFHHDSSTPFSIAYFETPGLWEGLGNSEKLARAIAQGSEAFELLDAPQLLKHALGLSKCFTPIGFRLLYLWYEVGGEPDRLHREEIERFARLIGQDFAFDSRSHQEVFAALKPRLVEHAAYRDYLAARYFRTP